MEDQFDVQVHEVDKEQSLKKVNDILYKGLVVDMQGPVVSRKARSRLPDDYENTEIMASIRNLVQKNDALIEQDLKSDDYIDTFLFIVMLGLGTCGVFMWLQLKK